MDVLATGYSTRRAAAWLLAACLAAAAAVAACGGKESTPTPTPTPTAAPAPSVTSVSPLTGPIAGGTAVTIVGANFAAGATVTIGGVAATNVAVVNANTITATTPSRAAGVADVVVTMSSGSGMLAGAFTYLAPTLTVTSVTPSTGTTLGGTPITIVGTNFAAGAIVLIGGVPAPNVVVQSATQLTAVTPQRAAAPVEVQVTAGGLTGFLPNGFTYVAPAAATNNPPAITAIVAVNARPRAPIGFANVRDELLVTATVVDAETPAAQLTYEWTIQSGTIVSGAGTPSIRWRAPNQATAPFNTILTLLVVERYQTTDSGGLPVTRENRVNNSTLVRVHDSDREVGSMAHDFLEEFSQQRLAPEVILRNFTATCVGYAAELDDVRRNQTLFRIDSYRIDPWDPVSLNFGGVCPFRARPGDACVRLEVDWRSTVRATGAKDIAIGFDHVSAVYRDNRWWLCDSEFELISTRDATTASTPGNPYFKK